MKVAPECADRNCSKSARVLPLQRTECPHLREFRWYRGFIALNKLFGAIFY